MPSEQGRREDGAGLLDAMLASLQPALAAEQDRLADDSVEQPARSSPGMVSVSGACTEVLALDGTLLFASDCGAWPADQTGLGDRQLGVWLRHGHADAGAALEAAIAGHSAQFQAGAESQEGEAQQWDVAVTPLLMADGAVDAILMVSRLVVPPHQEAAPEPREPAVAADQSWAAIERVREQDSLQRLLEEQLRQSQKMEAVGQLTGGLAHDFNNLLTGITGSLELLQGRLAQGQLDDLDRFIQAALGSAHRAAALTHRLLAFSRRQTLDPKPVDVNLLVESMAELIQGTVGPAIAVTAARAADPSSTLCDPNQLENALLNLCINAHDAMPAGGHLVIETANAWLDAAAAAESDMAPGHYVTLSVRDTGTGMTAEVAARAFDPFYTTKPLGEGTGLGLSMIYGFVKQSGGQIRVYTEVGLGTMMQLCLPSHYAQAAEAMEPKRPAAASAETGETVLLVDDEPTIRLLVMEVLQELGYDAIEAEDGASGLTILRSDRRIDLLITDVGLPGGMNGRQLAEAARAGRPALKVLFITGYDAHAVHDARRPGTHVLTKPFSIEALAAKIRAVIAGD